MKLGTTTHPKFRRLQKLLKLPSYAAAGLLEMLWMLASQYADDGDLSRFTPQEIADYCDYESDADSLVDALVTCKWLDRDADSLRIHDWIDHRPNYLLDRDRKRAERVAKQGFSGDNPELSRTFQDNPGKSSPSHSQAKPSPSHAMPNHAMPSQAKPDESEAAGERLAGLDFLRLAADKFRDVARQSKALDAAFGAVFESADEVWQIAWVGLACGEGVIPEVVTKFKDLKGTPNAIKQPKRWLLGCLRRELSKSGVTLEDALANVTPWNEAKEHLAK